MIHAVKRNPDHEVPSGQWRFLLTEFCSHLSQVQDEVKSFLKLLNEIYGIFGLDYTIALSTRPEGYLGELELWNQAEQALEDALKSTGKRITKCTLLKIKQHYLSQCSTVHLT